MPARAPRNQKITLGEMRASGVRKCSHSTAISGDRWPDRVRLYDIAPRFTRQACGQKGADVRPNFNWELDARRPRWRAKDRMVNSRATPAVSPNGVRLNPSCDCEDH